MDLSNREKEIFRIALRYAELYEYCNPVIGSNVTLAQKVANQLSFDVSDEDIAELSGRPKRIVENWTPNFSGVWDD